MTKISPSFDVIVVGGGMSGLRAARDLRDAGCEVLVLEARDRLGGRTWARRFPGLDKKVELGGSWIGPRFHRFVAAEMDRYGLSLDASPRAAPTFHWRFDGTVSRNFPVDGEDRYELERAVYRIIEASHRIDVTLPRDEQKLGDLDVSVEKFLRGLELSERTYEFLSAFGSLGSGASASEWSALTAFSLIAAFECSAYAWYAAVGDTIAGGTTSLVAALGEDARPEIRLSTQVTRIEQRPDEVVVSTAQGGTFTASAVVLAVPVNVWAAIDFKPSLSTAKSTMAQAGHPNRMGKVWALVEGTSPDAVGFGPRSELLYLASQYELEGASLMVGFTSPPNLLDVTDTAAVELAVRQYFPEAKVLASDAHDWNRDPYANGAWLTYRPGQASRLMADLQKPEGRVSFAGADIATRWIGWIDGALETGATAAAHALRALDAGVISAS